ncbi:anti sigma factor C-terminal domain-containing protein [Bacillus pinisoli]|uniref:anti sigma factor C-terminal domain-containing protein n=1 Tax=Bacillus pinisoli TaxID=2901866 RepID=UPI001FF3DF0D|nr:anti sigma factor C-terminal domain-containing protein [Bacillus pinisoli]
MKDYKEDEKERELNDLFGKDSSGASFEKIVKKAKRKTIVRNILISLLVMIVLIVALGFSWLSMMRANQEKAMRDVELFSHITRPNVEELGFQSLGNGLFEGILYYNRYKEIEGIPVDWSQEVVTYSLFGGVSKLLGDHTPIQLTDRNDGMTRYFDRETKQRIMEFYHPLIQYDFIRNDVAKVKELPKETLVELALSFNKKYTPEEVRKLMPDGVTVKWFWVDTYSNLDMLKGEEFETEAGEIEKIPAVPELANDIYGFEEFQEDPSLSKERFIEDIKAGLHVREGKYFSEYQRINNYLMGDSTELSSDQIYILGVVVTGTAEEMKELEKLEFFRSAVLGVTVDPNE